MTFRRARIALATLLLILAALAGARLAIGASGTPLQTTASADVVRDGCLAPTDRDGVKLAGYFDHQQQPLNAAGDPVTAITTHSAVPGDPADPNRPTTGPIFDAWIKPGDHNVASGTDGYRAECYFRFPSSGSLPAASWPDPPGSTREYTVNVRLDPQHFHLHASSSVWGPIVMQLKGHWGGSPVRSLALKAGRWYSDSSIGGRFDLGSAVLGRWERFTITTTWSLDKTVGGVQIARNGSVAVPWVHLTTLETTSKGVDPVYVKALLYDATSDTTEQKVDMGPITVSSVSPPAAAR